jgi:taurine dioxygenase
VDSTRFSESARGEVCTKLQIRRLAYALGAEVTGIDLRRPLDPTTIAAIRGAWVEHLVLCFPGQNLERDHLFTFAKQFGDLEGKSTVSRDSQMSQVGIVTERAINGQPWDGYKNGHNWHSDQSHTTQPTAGTFLACKEIPEIGGDTMFANLYMAYDTLSVTMQEIIDGLWAIHYRALPVRELHQGASDTSRAARERILRVEAESEAGPNAIHPAILIHPETNRKALYLGLRARRFVGMTDAESRSMLDFLDAHIVKYEFTYRHSWSAGDVIMWDNRCLLHIALCDYDFEHDTRHMLRCRTLGPKCGYPYTGEGTAGNAPVPLKQPTVALART